MAGNPFDQPAGNPFEDPAPQAPAAAPGNPFDEAPPPPPDMSATKEYFKKSIEESRSANPDAHAANGILEDLKAGWQMSVTGLATRGGLPDTVLPEHAGIAANIASSIGQLAGDVPAMVAGFFGGSAAGSAVAPIAGTAIGAAGGAFALPPTLRKIMMDHYERGDIQSADEFVHRAMGTMWEAAKGAAVGIATGAAGKVAAPLAEGMGLADSMAVASGKFVGPVAEGMASRLATPMAEIATMTTASAMLEGHLPNAEDFTTAAGVVALLHGLTHVGGGSARVASKMRDIYAETGIRPEQVAEDAKQDPVIHQELLMDNGKLPEAYGGKTEPGAKPPEASAAAQEGGKPAEKPTEAPAEPQDVAAARAKIRSQMGEKVDEKQGIVAKTVDYFQNKAYKDWVDRLDPIVRATKAMAEKLGRPLTADENPTILSRMANDAPAKVKHMIEKGTLDYNTLAVNGKGLKEIVAPHANDIPGLEDYLVSSRVLELDKRGIKHGFDAEAARTIVKAGKEKYGQAAQEITDFQNRNLQYLRDSGMISDKSFKAIQEANKNYVPFARLLDPEQGGGSGKKGNSLKRIKGSDKKIQSPLTSILENTEAMVKAAERNRAVSSFVDLAAEARDIGEIEKGATLEKVPGRSKAIEITDQEVAKFMKDHGLEGDAEGFTVFRGAPKDLGPNEFEVYRDGKREVYRADPDVAEAFNTLGGDKASMNFILRIAREFTAIKKLGITLTPDFILKNVFRDQLTAGSFSAGGGISFMGTMKAIGDIVSKNDTYYNWLKSGGAGGSFIELNDAYLKNDVFGLNKKTGFMDSTWNLVKHPIDAVKLGASILAEAGGTLEHATRLAEFKRIAGENTSGPKIFEGGFGAREVTVDFSRMGAKMSALNAITAFQNVQVQGLDRMARAFKEDPTGMAKKAAMYITLPSVFLWWANKDDERVKAIPRWERDLNWIIPTNRWVEATKEDHAEFVPDYLKRTNKDGKVEINKGEIYRLPKPQELGIVFGSSVERALDTFFTDNPRALKDFGDTMAGIVTPNYVPDVLQPMIEQKFNQSFFTGHQLVPGHLEKVAPAYRYTEYTSETAKQLGKLTAMVPGIGDTSMAAPAVIDNYIRSWGGQLGQYALQISDQGLISTGAVKVAPRPDWNLKDVPFVKAFVVRYPQANAQQIVDFKARYDEVQQKRATLDMLSKRIGMQDEWTSYFQSMHSEDFVQLDSIKQALDTSRQIIQNTNDDPSMSPHEKRQLIDGQYHMMIQVAGMANKMTDQLNKQLAESEKEFKMRIPPSRLQAIDGK